MKKALMTCVYAAVLDLAVLGTLAQTQNRIKEQTALRSTIAFVSTRHEPVADVAAEPQRYYNATEIYLMDGDGTNPRRLTENTYFDVFPALSPDGRRIVFDSNRLRTEGEALKHLGPVRDERRRHRADVTRAGKLRHLVPRRPEDRVPRLGVGHGAADHHRCGRAPRQRTAISSS